MCGFIAIDPILFPDFNAKLVWLYPLHIKGCLDIKKTAYQHFV